MEVEEKNCRPDTGWESRQGAQRRSPRAGESLPPQKTEAVIESRLNSPFLLEKSDGKKVPLQLLRNPSRQ